MKSSKFNFNIDFDQCLEVLTESDDSTREKFIKENCQVMSNVIQLLKKLTKKSQDFNEKLLAIKCLAKISEVDCQNISKCLMDLEDETDSNYFWKDVLDFLNEPEKLTDLSLDQVKLKLTILINIARKNITKIVKLFHNFKAIDKLFLNILSSIPSLPIDVSHFLIHLLLNISTCDSLIQSLVNNPNLLIIAEKIIELFESDNEFPKLQLVSIIYNFLLFDCLHFQLLDPNLNLVVKLLYPLSGSTSTQFDEYEMKKLNINLQYLDKEVESNLNVVKYLILCLNLFCNRKEGRDALKKNGAYYILRELHKCEIDYELKNDIENVIGILIKDESEYDIYPSLLKLKVYDD